MYKLEHDRKEQYEVLDLSYILHLLNLTFLLMHLI